MTDKRPCCRPASAHDWQPLAGDPNYLTCAKCGRLAGYQRGGLGRNRNRIKLYNFPEIESSIREKAVGLCDRYGMPTNELHAKVIADAIAEAKS